MLLEQFPDLGRSRLDKLEPSECRYLELTGIRVLTVDGVYRMLFDKDEDGCPIPTSEAVREWVMRDLLLYTTLEVVEEIREDGMDTPAVMAEFSDLMRFLHLHFFLS